MPVTAAGPRPRIDHHRSLRQRRQLPGHHPPVGRIRANRIGDQRDERLAGALAERIGIQLITRNLDVAREIARDSQVVKLTDSDTVGGRRYVHRATRRKRRALARNTGHCVFVTASPATVNICHHDPPSAQASDYRETQSPSGPATPLPPLHFRRHARAPRNPALISKTVCYRQGDSPAAEIQGQPPARTALVQIAIRPKQYTHVG